ncbi:MAG: hypothetical protein K2W85_09250 [Phycisphaerales bacterium]|nr:hypothetical protein [Phycisphaerales bacterium]
MPSEARVRAVVLAVSVGMGVCAVAHGQAVLAPTQVPEWSADFEPLVHEPHVGCGKACAYLSWRDPIADAMEFAPTGGLLVPGARTRFGQRGPGGDPTDVLNNSVAIEILSVTPPATGTGSGSASITGSNTMTIRSNVNGLTSFAFNLRSQHTVSSCVVTDSVGSYSVTPTTPPANNSSYRRTITFQRPINQGQTFTIAVSYSGSTVNVGLGSFFAGRQQGDNQNTSAPLVVCSLSQPYYAGTWWPCKDGDVLQPGDNIDRATLEMALTVPNPMTGVSNGVLVGVDVVDSNRTRFRYATSSTLPSYLVFIAASTYNQWSVNYAYPGEVMPVRFSIYPQSDTPTNRGVWQSTVDMLEAFRPVYGLYPFVNEQYGIYQFEFSGGMEHQTYTGQGRNGAFSNSITAHELAHQWWGDYVTCRTWSDIWLNEGGASYGEAIWEERRPGSVGFEALRAAMNARKPGANGDGTVYVPPAETNSVNRIFNSNTSYRKAGWVLHMLRKVMGDAAFWNLLQAYRTTYAQSAATTADFTTLASSVHGSDLSWFFNPWLYQSGAPTYTFGWSNVQYGSQRYVRLQINQTQAAATVFDMPMDVDIASTSGTQRVSVRQNARTEDYLIPVSNAATGVAIDPGDWILNYGKTGVAYVQGPPRIVSASIAPGASIVGAAPVVMSIRMSDAVSISAANIGVSRAGNAVAFGFAYDGPTSTVTLTFAGGLSAGTYDVSIADSVTAVANGLALDGEILSNTAGALPSGDGQPGGLAAFSFTVQGTPCGPDFDASGTLTVNDIFAFLNAWFAGQSSADVDGTSGLTVNDVFAFLNAWFAGC